MVSDFSKKVLKLRVEISKTIYSLKCVHGVEVHVTRSMEVIDKFELSDVIKNKITNSTSLWFREGVFTSVNFRANFIKICCLAPSLLFSSKSEAIITIQIYSNFVSIVALLLCGGVIILTFQ